MEDNTEEKTRNPVDIVMSDQDNDVSSARCNPSPSVTGATALDDSEVQLTQKVMDAASRNLIYYMKPDPILDCQLFEFLATRNIREEKNTTEKNRRIVETVRPSKTRYYKLKDCLNKTDQSMLVKLLERIEKGEDTSTLLQQIHETAIHEMPKKMKDLEEGMISLYRRQHSNCQLSPLLEDDTLLLEFYVIPAIMSVKVERGRGSVNEEKTRVLPFSKVFVKENKLCNEIYLTADAGLGKTAFSKRLALAWCHAKKPLANENQYFSREETEAISRFRFVFLLLLRASSSECDIDDLILKQIISQIPHTSYTLNDLEDILAKETCLVILDGLDEWSHPSNSCNQGWSSIPHRKARGCTVDLTTTRPWKLSVIGLKSSQIDQKLEITGLNPESANKLKRSVLSHLYKEKDENQLKTYVTKFTEAVEDKRISDLEATPLLLTYLLFLWYYKIELGHSQCDLYSNIVELLLSRTVKPNEILPSIDEHTQGDVPECFSKLKRCRPFYPRLTCLGQLAYNTLFGETREEHMLVFDRSVAENYLDEQCLNFFLRTGIITESKVPGTLLEHISKVSFAHKTVQEFFAALYVSSTPVVTPDQTSVPEIVLSKCNCVKDILEMSKFLIFLSGLNVNVSSSISRELMQIINEDVHVYRSNARFKDPLKQFQDMTVTCCKQQPHVNEVNLCLQHVFIDESCQQEQYRETLKQLTARNKQNIRSLYIIIYGVSCAPYISVQEVIEYFALSDLENIEKIYYTGEYNVMSHGQLTLLCDYISQRHCMREITLDSLPCTDHKRESGSGCSLDLSQHSQLKEIKLWDIPVSKLKINMSSLEECVLGQLSNPDLELHFINCVPTDSKVKKFVCRNLKSSAAIETIQQTLPLLAQVKQVVLWEINLGNKEVLTSEIIKNVQLLQVTMPASVLHGIVTVLQRLPQNVTVYVGSCNITPENEFVTVKEEIKQSSKFRVMADKEHWLQFEKIKDGD